MWPWRKRLPVGPTPLDYRVEALSDEIRRLRAALFELPTRPAFVCVLAEGDSEYGPRTLGGIGKVIPGGIEIKLEPQVALKNVRITVFCDLERVNVHAIFLGQDCATVALGTCPVAFFREWPIAQVLRVQCIEHKEPR